MMRLTNSGGDNWT